MRYTTQITVRLSRSQRQALEAQARVEHRSLAALCRRLLATVPAESDQPCLQFGEPVCPHERTYVHRRRRVCMACACDVGPALGATAAA